MAKYRVIIEKSPKSSNGCEWYKNGEIYDVRRQLGDYVVIDNSSSIVWAIRGSDARVLEEIEDKK